MNINKLDEISGNVGDIPDDVFRNLYEIFEAEFVRRKFGKLDCKPARLYTESEWGAYKSPNTDKVLVYCLKKNIRIGRY